TIDRMRGMDQGFGTNPGTLGWFLGVWFVMMAAMMLPSVAPTVALYSRITRSRAPLAPLAFTSGYLLTWGAAGLLAFGVASLIGGLFRDQLMWDRGGSCVDGGVVVVGALFAIHTLKGVCVLSCNIM